MPARQAPLSIIQVVVGVVLGRPRSRADPTRPMYNRSSFWSEGPEPGVAVPDARSNDPEMESCGITKQRRSPHTHKHRSLHTHRWLDKTDSGSSWQGPYPCARIDELMQRSLLVEAAGRRTRRDAAAPAEHLSCVAAGPPGWFVRAGDAAALVSHS